MQDFRVKQRVKRGAMQFGEEKVRSWGDEILGTPKDIAKNTIAQLVAWGMFLTFVPAGKAVMAFWVTFMLTNPLLAIVIFVAIATIIIGLGCYVSNRFFGKWTQVNMMSENYTQAFEQGLKEADKVYFKRLTPGSKECDDITQKYKENVERLYKERSKSLGFDIEEVINDHKGRKFQAMCAHARKVLNKFPIIYSSSKLTASQFSPDRKSVV